MEETQVEMPLVETPLVETPLVETTREAQQRQLKLVFLVTVVPIIQQVSGNSNSSVRKWHRTTPSAVAITQVLPLVSLLQDWIA
ncbi:hypothetical protein LSAT2_007595 [Lamellibrachia satsuma]|nr:hypothetical protein LSAT2_007595 [Lamellibrachia satsuma]